MRLRSMMSSPLTDTPPQVVLVIGLSIKRDGRGTLSQVAPRKNSVISVGGVAHVADRASDEGHVAIGVDRGADSGKELQR